MLAAEKVLLVKRSGSGGSARRRTSSHGKADSLSLRKKLRSNKADYSRADGKQMVIQEAKRTMTGASATSQLIVNNFVNQLKSYRTFQPLFKENQLYSPDSTEEVHNENQWEVIDNLIKASTFHLLRNRTDEHFFATFSRVTGEFLGPFRQRRRSHKVGFAKDQYDINDTSLEKKSRSFVETWKRNHPLATDEEAKAESFFWESAFSHQEKATRQAYLSQLHREIDSLVRSSVGEEKVAEEVLEDDEFSSLADGEAVDEQQVEEQRRAWVMFTQGEDCPTGFTFPGKAPRIIDGYENSEALHEWLQGRWSHHTHRHENAAFMIQRAYRSFKAKREVAKKRFERAQCLRELLAVEEETIAQWNAAVQQELLTLAQNSENTREYRAMKLFTRKIVALVAKRRKQRETDEAQRSEVKNYAATLIQKVFRGFLARKYGVRYPEVQAARHELRRHEAAARIQSLWKCRKTMMKIRLWREAALRIQCCYRQHRARTRCRFLRGVTQVNIRDVEKVGAAHTLVSFNIRNIYNREAFYRKNKTEIDLLQRIGRGYLHRAFTYSIPLQRMKVSAAAKVLSRWSDILVVRRARFFVGTFQKQRAKENWQLIRFDAAKTIQCAWRNYKAYKEYYNRDRAQVTSDASVIS